MAKEIKYLVISDIHLGHRRTSTSEIIKALDTYFDNYRSTSQFIDIDILFIAGDLFDTLLDVPSSDIRDILVWMDRLMHFCGKHNIKLRLLEGTPSHDWKQSRMIESLYNITASHTALNFRYIQTLYIEQMDDLELSVLYVPDEWTSSTDLTFKQVRQLMSEAKLDIVDIAIMHGAFGFQLKQAPAHIQRHSEADYLSIVKYWINAGHVHNHSFYDRILIQGSFDRLAHGEEEPKGGILCSIRGSQGSHWEFIENPKAKIYKTVVIKSNDLDKSMEYLHKAIHKLPINSHVRIKAVTNHPIYVALDDIKLKYTMFYFSRAKVDTIDNESKTTIEIIDTGYTPVSITPDNIVDLLMTEIKTKHMLSDDQYRILTTVLEDINVK